MTTMIATICVAGLIFATTVLAQTEVGLGQYEFRDDPQAQDLAFDAEILPNASVPSTSPTADEVQQLCDRTYGTSAGIEVDLAVNYLNYDLWYSRYTRCCPQCQGFQCGTSAQRMPCFYYNRAWCCPIRPYYIVNCNCGTCVKVCPSPQCLTYGRCARRYRLTTVYAVCHSLAICIITERYLPSSCYCSGFCNTVGVVGPASGTA